MKVFIHRKEKCLGITDHPVCHGCSCNRDSVLFPVLFLTEVWHAVTELLVHNPCNGIRRYHSVKHVWFSVFSFSDNRKRMFAIVGTGIVYTVEFNHTQLSRNKNQFPAHKLLTDLFQWGITNRTDFFLLWKIKVSAGDWDSFKTVCICGSGFTLFCCGFSKWIWEFLSFDGSQILFHFRFIKKIQLARKINRRFFTGRTE